MSAGAEETPEAPEQPPAATADGAPAPPEELPWGEEPEAVKKGAPGATSASLAATGADIAPADANASTVPKAEWGPKGYTSRKRTRGHSRTTVAPQPPVAKAEPVATASRDVKYHYSSAYQFVQSDGTYANMVISKPYLDTADFHTLAEIAVQSADGSQIVEVGWTVDRNVNSDEDPHLFVYHWVDGKETCYNACGWRQYSSTVVPGDTLPTGVAKRFGIQYYQGAWWVAYDSEWVGYFPDRLWGGDFTRSGLIQWFGEVASTKAEPCTDMGTGYDASRDSAARFGSISLINGPAPVATVRSSSPDGAASVYPVNSLSDRTFRYGGPGRC